jgi:hypothetical protein
MPGLYRMVHPLVAAGFVGMFRGPLNFMLPIEISAARTIRSACLWWSLRKTNSPLYVEHSEGDGGNIQSHLQAWLGGHRLKETGCAVQVRAIKGVAENQKSQSASGYEGH